MNRKAFLIPVVSCHFIVQSLTLSINIRFQHILRGMSEVAEFCTDVLDVLNIICCKFPIMIFRMSVLYLRAFIFNLLKRILLIRQFLCSFLQMSALQFFLFCLVKKLICRHQFTNTLFNDIPLKDRSSIRLHDASF